MALSKTTGVDGNRTHHGPRERLVNGFEGRRTPDVSNEKTSTSDLTANAVHQGCHQEGSELAEIATAWPSLPSAIRAGVLALVRTAIAQAGAQAEPDFAASKEAQRAL